MACETVGGENGRTIIRHDPVLLCSADAERSKGVKMCVNDPEWECDNCYDCMRRTEDYDDYDERAAEIRREELYFGRQ